jgi:hypothetical protein
VSSTAAGPSRSGRGSTGAIAVDETYVYWTDSTDTVSKVPIAGGEPTPIATGQKSPFGIAADAKYVYWTNVGTAENDYRDGEVMKVAK